MDNKEREKKVKTQLKKLNHFLDKEEYNEIKIMCKELIVYWSKYDDKEMIDYFETQLEETNKIIKMLKK